MSGKDMATAQKQLKAVVVIQKYARR
jgi:hypothetical protein